MAARVTIVDAEDFQGIYVGASLFKQQHGGIFNTEELCELFDQLNISVNVIESDDRIEAFIYEGNELPDKLSEVQQIIGGR
jgi:hypothetical protein